MSSPETLYIIKPPAKNKNQERRIRATIDELKDGIHIEKLDIDCIEIEFDGDIDDSLHQYNLPELWIFHNSFMAYPIYAVMKFDDGSQKVVMLATSQSRPGGTPAYIQ